jgi:hypothetical protein
MRPKEFDDLIRNKFDQNDFAYSPQNWELLAEQLDGKTKRRSLMIWWWVPLAGMAASVLMAMGVTTMMRHDMKSAAPSQNVYAHAHTFSHLNSPDNSFPAHEQTILAGISKKQKNGAKHPVTASVKDNTDSWFNIKYENAVPEKNSDAQKNINLLLAVEPNQIKKKIITPEEPHPTFKPEDELKKTSKFSIILSGGVDHGNQSSGYAAGVAVRRMVNDKVFVEGNVAFASSSNNQSSDYTIATTYSGAPVAFARNSGATAARSSATARTTTAESEKSTLTQTTYTTAERSVTYNANYLQITPSIGYKLLKRMSIGVGPDLQQMLADNRPPASTTDRNNIQEAPVFDVGFIGKTEYVLTKKLKAGVYYRKGVNDLISPSDKYTNRDYLQFQLKCVIFNK